MQGTTAVQITYDKHYEKFTILSEGKPRWECDDYETAEQFCKDHNFLIVENGTSFAYELGWLIVRWSESLTDEEKEQVLPALIATTDHAYDENADQLREVLRQFVKEGQ